MNEELLTESEVIALEMCGTLFNHIVRNVMEGGKTVMADATELSIHIHGIQNMLLAQAAARRYPDKYRRLGATLNKQTYTEEPG